MLNEYLPNKLLKEELIKRDYILTNVKKDDNWKGGKLIVPFKASGASSIRMGGLTGQTDIAEDQYIRGSIDDYTEAWGSMIFNHRDLIEHNGKIPESTFLKILPDTVDDFMAYMKMVVSIQLGTGPHMSEATVDGTAGGVMGVSRVDRFCLDQKITWVDGDTVAADYYVIAIDMNTSLVTFSAPRGGAAADLSAYTVAADAKAYTDDADVTSFTSIRSVLLSVANGGSANVYGQSKLAYPFLQAINVDGSTITASNMLDKLFDSYTEVRIKAKGMADRFLMSYKNFGTVLKQLQNQGNLQGQYQLDNGSRKASVYGWDEISITSVKGTLKVVGIQEWDDDTIAILDMNSMVFRSNGFFRKRMSPDGLEYFEVRNQNGYQYILDLCLFGELEINKPGQNGIIYGISY